MVLNSCKIGQMICKQDKLLQKYNVKNNDLHNCCIIQSLQMIAQFNPGANTNSKITTKLKDKIVSENAFMDYCKGGRSKAILVYFLCIIVLPHQCMSLSMTVTSVSNVIGADTDYTLTLTNHSQPVTIRTQFGQWTPWQAQPYGSNYQFFLTSGSLSSNLLTCRSRFANTLIECAAPTPTSSLGPTIQLLIRNIKNPSSAKPYPVTITFIYANGTSQVATASRTVTSVPTSIISFSGYNSTVGVISSTTSWALTFDYYFDYSTVLRIVYDGRLITLGFTGLTGVMATITNASNTITVKLTNWSDTASGLHLIGSIATSNPQASITTSANCFLEFTEASITYSIQSYTATFSIVPSVFSTVTATSSLQMGLSGQTISFSALVCPYSPVNLSASNTSYTDLIIGTSNIVTTSASCSAAVNSSGTCRFNTAVSPKTITPVTQTITSSSVTPVTAIVYTYFAPLSAYYPLCSQVYNIQLLPQDLTSGSIVYNLSKCGSGTTGELNSNTAITIQVENAAAGDIFRVGLAMGVLGGSWTRVDNTITTYKYTLVSADIINSTFVSAPMPFTNPTLTTTANSLTSLTLSRLINTTEALFLRTSPTSLTVPLCPVTIPSQLLSPSLSLSTTATYSPTSTSLRFRNKFADYSPTDYLRINFKNYENVLFLTTAELAAGLGGLLMVNGTNSSCQVTVVNNTVIHVNNISRINTVGVGNELYLTGLVNPATIYPIVAGAPGFQVVGTFMTATGQQKQQTTITFSTPTTSNSNFYTLSTIMIDQSPDLPILKSASLTLNLSNSLKPKYFLPMATTSVRLNLPFTCTQTNTNGSMTVTWQSFVPSLMVSLTNCNVGYFNTSLAKVEIIETLGVTNATNSSGSTTTVYPFQLACLDNCLVCNSAKYCSSCVNSTFSYYLLYNGLCYSTCPSKTYTIANSSLCKDCHISCQTCSGSQMTECTTCLANFVPKAVNGSTSICVSVCGQGMILNTATSKCEPCEVDCKYCINAQHCYICKDGASLVGTGICDFVDCTDPCQTCEGSMTNCTACINNLYLYDFQCFDTCPTKTYPSVSAQNRNICLEITSPTLYFPATICSIVLIVLVCICNTCIDRGLTADSQRRNINMLIYSSSILAFMELFALFVMVALTFNATSRGLGLAGLGLWVLCNVLFGVYYCRVIKNDEAVIAIVTKMTSQSKCIYYGIVGFSIGIALRAYRILYCGLFRGVAPYPVKKKSESSILKKRKGSQGRIANQTIPKTVQKLTIQPEGQQTKVKNTDGKASSMSKKTVKNNQKRPDIIQPQIPIQIIEESENTSVQSSQQHSKFQLKRPYIIYITIGSLLASILFLAAGISEIIKNAYLGMLFWGLDLLIVSVASIIVTGFDMWAGVKKSYLMALDKAPVNETMENLRAEEDEATHQKILANAKVTQKVNKNSPLKKPNEEPKKPIKKKYVPPQGLIRKKSISPPKEKVLSPQQKEQQQKVKKLKSVKSRYSDLYKRSKKPQEEASSEDDHDEIPDIKMFQDVEMYTNDDIQPAKKIKKIKSDNKRMTSMQNMRKGDGKSPLAQSSYGNLGNLGKSTKGNWKLDDIFLGFKDSEQGGDEDKKTVKINADRQIYEVPFSKKQQKPQQSQQDPASYINSLERDKNRKEKEKQQAQDIQQNQFNLSAKSDQAVQENADLSPQKKEDPKEK